MRARIEALTHHCDPATRSEGHRIANRGLHGVIHTMARLRNIVDDSPDSGVAATS